MSKIDDVAKLAGVSKGTVSNVFSRKRPISEKVQKRVLEAAKELNYTPNHIARSLVTKKTMTISLSMPSAKRISLTTFHTNLINGVITEASLHNYRILIDTLAQEELELPFLSGNVVDGVIVLNPKVDDTRLDYLTKYNIPAVVIGEPSAKYKNLVSYVDNNNQEIVEEVTTYLLKKGHRRILYLNAPTKMTVSKVREAGFLQAFADLGISNNESLIHFKESLYEDPSQYGYDTVMKYFAADKDRYTAIIADTDKEAIGICRAFRKLNIKFPDDVAIVALSDDLVLSHELEPPIPTVDMQAEALGKTSVQMLFHQIKVGDYPEISRAVVKAKFHSREQ
ncbi:LacI family DNA-binding transcriptional regulator [Gracilibacillus alcaliphilus]|uniref:LacI family DNA-binding transcriptional regulator n=1 Tax=Gracilibacillus alcaliphilus TaxID=1401441 RepID=UPI00195C3E91|nr:LacI family DNA-binding transcriptional regulator [Gracilibacillus alcaliphilus]MBM7676747.1 DNA-binding LacI/PurR family transcriptional regulator [Gracilibacillus alcaliphilus]